jgi:hypothetical protein
VSADAHSIPQGTYTPAIDDLLDAKADAIEKRREFYGRHEAAGQAVPVAVREDREAYAKALRSKDGKDPGQKKTQAAEKALLDARRSLEAADEAVQSIERDLIAAFQEEQQEVRVLLERRHTENRAVFLEALEQLSLAAVAFTKDEAAQEFADAPLQPSGKLRPFVVRPVHIKAKGERGAWLSMGEAIQRIGARVEESAIDVELTRAGRAVGIAFDRISVIYGRSLAVNGRPITDASKIGLCRIRIERGATAAQLIVAEIYLERTSPEDILRENQAYLNSAFHLNTRYVFSQDAETRAIVQRVAPDKDERQRTRRLEVTDIEQARADREQRPRAPAQEPALPEVVV